MTQRTGQLAHVLAPGIVSILRTMQTHKTFALLVQREV